MGTEKSEWLQRDPEAAGVLYVDGHVRVYPGELAVLPRRYVSRERLCLRGTSDYWVNDQIGQPHFVVSCEFNDGLLAVLREQIVPRLLREVPQQPTAEQRQADPRRHRFLLVFDREGSSPAFFKEMWQTHRIACVSYRKQPMELWEPAEFVEQSVSMAGGGVVNMRLAERGTHWGNELWVREIRKLGAGGAADQFDHHRLRVGGRAGRGVSVQSLVSGKLHQVYDGTFCDGYA